MTLRSHTLGAVTEALLGQTISLCGWVQRRRDHGGVIFIDLRDREGLVQVVCDPDRADMFAVAEGVRNEYCVQVRGLVRARPQGTENASLGSGKVEVLCHELQVLNPSAALPFQLDGAEDFLAQAFVGHQLGVARGQGQVAFGHDHVHVGQQRAEKRPLFLHLL